MSEQDKWESYKDVPREWDCRRAARNGRAVGASLYGYKNKMDCVL